MRLDEASHSITAPASDTRIGGCPEPGPLRDATAGSVTWSGPHRWIQLSEFKGPPLVQTDSVRAWTTRMASSITRPLVWAAIAFLLFVGWKGARSQSPDEELDLGSVRLALARLPAPVTCRMGESFPDAHTDARELPPHDVRITKIRWAGRHEVTNAEFAAFLNAAGGASGRAVIDSQDYGVQRWYDDELGGAEIHNVASSWTVDSAGVNVPPVRDGQGAFAWTQPVMLANPPVEK